MTTLTTTKRRGRPPTNNGLTIAKKKYIQALHRQTKRMGRVFELTFEEWYNWWLKQGVDKNIESGPVSKSFLCMVLLDETKPVTLDNIQAATHGSNTIGKPSRSAGKTRPNCWKIKDPELHNMYIPFLKHRSQANYRLEAYELTWEDWISFWTTANWVRRGRQGHDLCLTRHDPEGAWSKENCLITTRSEQLKIAHAYTASKGIVTGRKKGTPNKKKKLVAVSAN